MSVQAPRTANKWTYSYHFSILMFSKSPWFSTGVPAAEPAKTEEDQAHKPQARPVSS
jgi:hypothetical protein